MIRNLLKKRILLALIAIVICVVLSIHYYSGKTKCRVDFGEYFPSTFFIKSTNLTVPKDIGKAVGSNEWISKSYIDKKRECPPLLADNIKRKNSNLGCEIPDLDPFHASMLQQLKDVKMPNCPTFKSYGKLVHGKVKFIDASVVSANYRRIVRDGDFKFLLGTSVPVPKTDEKNITDEYIEVEYILKDGKKVKEVFMQPVPHEHLLKRTAKKKPGIPLNIIVIGLDSLSHANSRRKLPKLYEYLKKDLGSFIFNGHSIVGDGTTEQLAAMLTGLGELEQYESRRHHKNPKPVDGWNWIFKQLKEHGYLTGYSEDTPNIGSFQYRLMGFNHQPTDFYTRPFYQRASQTLKGDHCLDSRTISQCQFNYVRDIFEMFPDKLKFFFSWNDAYSHNDNNNVAKFEPDLLSFVKDLKGKGHLNNTLLIIMGDHGARYGSVRALLQGKIEERLPLFSMTFPPWFSSRYPKLVNNLRTNTDRLTSWFDVYATFRHMLSYPEIPSGLKHGTSLMTEIPASRTCADATVEQHWCPCLQWEAIDTKHSHAQSAALAAVEFINSANQEHSASAKKCEELSLKTINYALLERPNDKMMSFQQTNDLIPAFNAKSRPSHKDFCRYQIQFVTSPNNGIYEATVRYHKTWFIVSKSISRVNEYGDQPECIERDLPHLRKFCFCRSKRRIPPQKGHFFGLVNCS